MRILILILILLVPASAMAASTGTRMTGVTARPGTPSGGGGPTGVACTDGVDCVCDTIVTTSPLVLCEDWDDPSYYDDTAESWAAGAVGPGGNWYRGSESQFFDLYGGGDNGLMKYQDGAPYIGSRCEFGPGAPGVGPNYQGCAMKEYCSSAQGALTTAGVADCWGPNVNSGAPIDIQRTGDFDEEVAGLSLVNGKGEGPDVGGGNAHFAFRIAPDSTAGKLGEAYLNAGSPGSASDNDNLTEVGITMALAYSPNILTETDSVMGYNGGAASAWKHDEWDDGGNWYVHWNLGNTGCGSVADFPHRPIIFTQGNVEAACDAEAASSVIVGNAYCSDVALQMCSTSATYSITQPDSPIGRWGCHQAHIKGLGTADVEVKISWNGVTVFHMDGFNGALLGPDYFDRFIWNAYANRNQGDSPQSQHTDVTQYRYEDSVVVVNGPPEPCSKIGF